MSAPRPLDEPHFGDQLGLGPVWARRQCSATQYNLLFHTESEFRFISWTAIDHDRPDIWRPDRWGSCTSTGSALSESWGRLRTDARMEAVLRRSRSIKRAR